MSKVLPFCTLLNHEEAVKGIIWEASQSELVSYRDYNGSGQGNSLTSILELDILPVNSQSIPQEMSQEFQLGLPNVISLDQVKFIKVTRDHSDLNWYIPQIVTDYPRSF